VPVTARASPPLQNRIDSDGPILTPCQQQQRRGRGPFHFNLKLAGLLIKALSLSRMKFFLDRKKKKRREKINFLRPARVSQEIPRYRSREQPQKKTG